MAAQIEINIKGGGGGASGGGGAGGTGGAGGNDIARERARAAAKDAEAALKDDGRRARAGARAAAKDAEAAISRQKKEEELQGKLEAKWEKQAAARFDREFKRKDAEDAREVKRVRDHAAKTAAAADREIKAEQESAAKDAKAKADSLKLTTATGVAGVAAALIRGGGVGSAAGGGIGSALGGAVGSRFGGPAGRAIGTALGGAVGEKAGGAADNFVPGAGRFGVKVAQGQGGDIATGAVSTAANAASVALAAIPGVGLPAAIAMQALGKSAGAAVEVMNAFAARGKELAGYNGKIAGAVAQQDVARLLSDIKESQRLGDGYANVIKSQTQFEETLKAGLIPIKEWILGVLPKYMGWILDAIIKALEIIDGIYQEFNSEKSILGRMADDMRRARAALEKKDVDADKLIDTWLGPELPSMKIPTADVTDSPIGVPLFAAP